MPFANCSIQPMILSGMLLLMGASFPPAVSAADAPAVAEKASSTVRSRAVVDFGFEEPQGDARDAATSGHQADAGQVKNGVQRVDSPFWGQAGRRAVLLNANRMQAIHVPESQDVSRPNAVSLSLFFLNLHPLNDANFHGLVAKRAEAGGGNVTNYGINYRPNGDALQLYLNDGSGFRSAVYSLKDVIGSRRLAHLTAVWEVADAPEPDADADRDDVRIQLFLNGQSVAPKSISNGQMAGQDAWLPNVNVAKLLHTGPVTLGSSTPTTEFTSGLLDEFLLFDQALTPEQAAQLFQEVAGPEAVQLAKQELAPPTALPRPQLAATSLHGLQAGHTTRLTLRGANLSPNPRLVVPGVQLEQKLAAGSNAGQFTADVTLPSNSPLGWFPLFVETDQGVSNSLAIAIDTLPQLPSNGTSPEQPATNLPAAFSGLLTGSNSVKIYVRGQAGQRLAAEVEAHRLGSASDPVVEIKTDRGTPLKIAWGHTALRGDARAEVRLPDDGLYVVELHDLEYKAPGQNRVRLKVGDFRSVDQWFPAAASPGQEVSLTPIGAGLPENATLDAVLPKTPGETHLPMFQAGWEAVGPLPPLSHSQATELQEAPPAEGLQTVNAQFQQTAHLPLAINGIVQEPGEVDRYLLEVMPGQKLRFAVEARVLSSPLDALLTVRNHPQGNVLVYKEDSGTLRDPVVDFTVPANVKQIQVGVEDLHERGGEAFTYRLKISPQNAPDFAMQLKTASLTLPENGTGVIEMTLSRRGYNGPIALRVLGDPSVSIQPAQIPAGKGNRDLFVTLIRQGEEAAQGFRGLQIVGESAGLDPALVRVAEVTPAAGVKLLPGHATLLPTSIESSAPFRIDVPNVPPVLFKGAPTLLVVLTERPAEQAKPYAVRLSLLTTEPTRPNDPKDPKKGNKPKIRSQADAAIGRGQNRGTVRLVVPLDVAAAEVDAVLKAELVPHPYSDQVAGTVYSFPMKFAVQTAATVKLDPNTLKLIAGKANVVRGTIQRAAGFEKPVTVSLVGLPAGYQQTAATVPPDSKTFELQVTPANEAQAKTIKANLSVALANGGPLLPNQAVDLKIAPAQ